MIGFINLVRELLYDFVVVGMKDSVACNFRLYRFNNYFSYVTLGCIAIVVLFMWCCTMVLLLWYCLHCNVFVVEGFASFEV